MQRLVQEKIPLLQPGETLSHLQAKELLPLTKGIQHEISKVGFVEYRKMQKILLEIGSQLYQAGMDLESKVAQLGEKGCENHYWKNLRRAVIQAQVCSV